MIYSLKIRNLLFLLALIGMTFSGHAAEKIGVVFLHGKLRSPEQMSGIAGYLEREGFLVSAPELSWSKRRSYDSTLEETAVEVTAAIDALRKQGAAKVVLLGQSLGTVFAAYYRSRWQAGCRRDPTSCWRVIMAHWLTAPPNRQRPSG